MRKFSLRAGWFWLLCCREQPQISLTNTGFLWLKVQRNLRFLHKLWPLAQSFFYSTPRFLRNGVAGPLQPAGRGSALSLVSNKAFPATATVRMCVYGWRGEVVHVLLWLNPIQQLSPTQPLTHSPWVGWGRESEGQK